MDFKENPFQFSETSITPMGIKFNDHFYSCPIAIKEQWYQHAAVSGEWKLPIYFNPHNPEIIILSLELKGLHLAYRIEVISEINHEEQLAYSQKLRILSNRFRRAKKNKLKKSHLPNDVS